MKSSTLKLLFIEKYTNTNMLNERLFKKSQGEGFFYSRHYSSGRGSVVETYFDLLSIS